MTGKEFLNLIRALRSKGISAEEILDITEIVESHSPEEDGKVKK